MKTLSKYAAVFGRDPAVIREPLPAGHTYACMFPPTNPSFWRRLMSEASDVTVYVTAGLTNHKMLVPPERSKYDAAEIELIAFSEVPIGVGESGNEDMPSAILQMIADYIIDERLVIGLGHTLDFQKPFAPNVEMSAVLFAAPVGVDAKRIMRCAGARDLLNIVPITKQELQLVRSKDVGVLLDLFEANEVAPMFDVFRKSVV